MSGELVTPDLPPKDPELSERLDKMWREHILACLAIINAGLDIDK